MPLPKEAATLPVSLCLDDLKETLKTKGCAVLQAPPGAGKTTVVPLALLDEAWLQGQRILMLEPRRLATRGAARRMAQLLSEAVGETVGYRMRLDTKVGPKTRVEVVTEGILLRMLQEDPSLEGVGIVIFDEFHERSLDADLGLALTLDVRRYLRDDLKLVVMSATLDGAPVARLLGDAPMITAEGRMFPVETRWLDRLPADRPESGIASAINKALREETGSLLVFLPGGPEIRRVERLLGDDLGPGVTVHPLYGDLPQAAQDVAIRPAASGHRKIVLSTSIAETSLTIEGVRVVIDSGLMRVPVFEPRSGMTRLDTVRVSQAAADQRRGRAGRTEPGVCYRLWREAEQAVLQPFTTPEILVADLAPLALDLACWGTGEAEALSWLDPPPAPALAQARDLLQRLDALDSQGRITKAGREMAALGAHPRLAHMLLRGRELEFGRLASEIAALIEERDVLKSPPGRRDPDLRLRIELMRDPAAETRALPEGFRADRNGLRRADQAARQYRRQLKIGDRADDIACCGMVLALAYPDRIAQRRAGSSGQYRLANGRGAELPAADALAREEFLAAADLDGDRRSARIFLAAPLDFDEIETVFESQIEIREAIAWDEREEAVTARRERRFGELILRADALPSPAADRMTEALIEGIRKMGLAALPWTPAVEAWRQRVRFLSGLEEGWPDLSDETLLTTLEDWLAPWLGGMSRRGHLTRLDLLGAFQALLDHGQRQRLEAQAPTHVTVPSGSRLPIDYDEEPPVLAVRLQEMFGAKATPEVAGGKVPLVLHLLSPAGRPLQVTRDLAGFWATSYKAVRAEMRGRYPKHPWPEDPASAEPTARAKRRS